MKLPVVGVRSANAYCDRKLGEWIPVNMSHVRRSRLKASHHFLRELIGGVASKSQIAAVHWSDAVRTDSQRRRREDRRSATAECERADDLRGTAEDVK